MKKFEQSGELRVPVHHPHYRQMHAVGVYELKKAVYAYCCGVEEEEKSKFKEDAIIPELLPIWQAFKKNGFDFYKFMVEKDYELIEDEELRIEVLMSVCFPMLSLPIARFMVDWLNGYLDFFKRDSQNITDTDVLCLLFFCSTERDIWKMMAEGIGDIDSLYWWYSQTSDKRVAKQLESDNVSEIKMSVDQFEKVGTLSAYYAKEDIEYFKKGQLICDSNDPINRIVDNNATHYKYEGDDTGEYYSYLLPKSKVDKKTYTMYQLPVALIGKRAVFVSNEGDSAKIFQSNINKHKYWEYDIINGEYKKRISYEETDKHSACYVLSVISPNGNLFEQPLEEQLSNVRLYRKNPCGDGVAPSDCRYREGEIGIIEYNWIIDNYDEWPDGKSAYDADGRLLVDQCRNDGISGYMSIAFLPALDALYIDGDLYYRKK